MTISHNMMISDKKVVDRVLELGNLSLEANELFTEGCKGNPKKFTELAKKCVEIGIVADSIAYEMYVSKLISLEELDKTMFEKIEGL